jgi:hypothetical protein
MPSVPVGHVMEVGMRNRVRSNRLAIWAAVGLVGFATASGTAGSQSSKPANRCDAITVALESALEAYARGDLAKARTQTVQAATLLEELDASDGAPARWPSSNSRQLLDALQVYDAYVRGADPARDERVDSIGRWLGIVDRINLGPSRPSRVRAGRTDYDPFTGLVRRIGDTAIDYDPFTLQLRRIGDIGFEYDPFTHLPRRIGEIGLAYDPFDRHLHRIAEVDL